MRREPTEQKKKEPAEVIVVHSDESVGVKLSLFLPRIGMKARTVKTGRQAVLAALERPPGAILMGIKLPKLGGIAALKIIKAIEPLRRVPVLMLTDLRSKEDVVNALRAGAVDYITKPFELKNVGERLARAMSAARAPVSAFSALRYSATADALMGTVRIHLNSAITPHSAAELLQLVKILGPLQPGLVELDFAGVPKISGRPVLPLAAVKQSIAASGGKVMVTGFDAQKYSFIEAGLIRNKFQIAADAPAVATPTRSAARLTARDDGPISEVLEKMTGLRFDMKRREGYAVLDFSGDMTFRTLDRADKAFESAAGCGPTFVVRLNKITSFGPRGVENIVRRMAELKKRGGATFYVISPNPDFKKLFTAARGFIVASLFDRIETVISHIRRQDA